jgi:hypothetical protein
MGLSKISRAWKDLVNRANSQGIPIPMLRYKGEGNPALTVFVISSALVIVGIVGKWAGYLGGIDMNNAMQFFYASSTLFFGHSWVHKNGLDLDDGGNGHSTSTEVDVRIQKDKNKGPM